MSTVRYLQLPIASVHFWLSIGNFSSLIKHQTDSEILWSTKHTKHLSYILNVLQVKHPISVYFLSATTTELWKKWKFCNSIASEYELQILFFLQSNCDVTMYKYQGCSDITFLIQYHYLIFETFPISDYSDTDTDIRYSDILIRLCLTQTSAKLDCISNTYNLC